MFWATKKTKTHIYIYKNFSVEVTGTNPLTLQTWGINWLFIRNQGWCTIKIHEDLCMQKTVTAHSWWSIWDHAWIHCNIISGEYLCHGALVAWKMLKRVETKWLCLHRPFFAGPVGSPKSTQVWIFSLRWPFSCFFLWLVNRTPLRNTDVG